MVETQKNSEGIEINLKKYLEDLFGEAGLEALRMSPDEIISKLRSITKEQFETATGSKIAFEPKP